MFIYHCDLHNEVNKSLGKRIYSYEEGLAKIYKYHYNNPYSLGNIKEKDIHHQKYGHFLIILFILFIRHIKKNTDLE